MQAVVIRGSDLHLREQMQDRTDQLPADQLQCNPGRTSSSFNRNGEAGTMTTTMNGGALLAQRTPGCCARRLEGVCEL